MYKMQKLAQLINRIREIVSFELGKEIQKDIFLPLSQEASERGNPKV